ncbi:nucleotidyltransferase family protein [Thermovibrio sp.]
MGKFFIFPHKEEILKVIIDRAKPKEVILFGSRAKGSFSHCSDIDLAIKGALLSFREKRKLKEEVDEKAGIFSVDILFYEELSQEMKETIDGEGVVLWKR